MTNSIFHNKSTPWLLFVILITSFTFEAKSQQLSVKQKDDIYLSSSWKDFWKKFEMSQPRLEVSIQSSVEKTTTSQYTSPFIYSANHDAAFPIGFKVGTSWDIQYKKKTNWSVSTYINYLSSSVKQDVSQALLPFVGDYYTYPLKNPTWYLGSKLLFKKSLFTPIDNHAKLNWVIGPGIDIQISPQNMDQSQYKKANYYFISGNTGLELSNKKQQNIGLYYQYGSNGLSRKINTRLISWQFSLIIPLKKKNEL